MTQPTSPTNTLEYACGCTYPTTENSSYYHHMCAKCLIWAKTHSAKK